MRSPKAVFFDLDETLAENIIPVPNLFAEMYQQFRHELGANNQQVFFSALRRNAAELWASMFDHEKAPEAQLVECFADSIRATAAVTEAHISHLAETMYTRFQTLSVNNVRLNDGALETLAALHAAGFITGIITNGMEQVQLGKIVQLGLDTQVDHVIISAQARAHKPHPKVFEHALAKAGVKAEQAWQVGDHATNDVAGAIRAGMTGVFYDPLKVGAAEAFADLEETPTFVANHLLEVVALAQC